MHSHNSRSNRQEECFKSVENTNESTEKIIVALNGQVSDLDSEVSSIQGMVFPKGVLSQQQLTTLRQDIARLETGFGSSMWMSLLHFHTSQLHLDSENVDVLKMICDHPLQGEREAHLSQFLTLLQHGVHIPEWVAKQSLSNLHIYWNNGTYNAVPFMVQITNSFRYGLELSQDFNNWICEHPCNPYTLENLYLLAKSHPDVKIGYEPMLRVFMCLSSEEQKALCSCTSEYVRALMASDWYIWDEQYKTFHLDRLKQNLPIVEFSFNVKSGRYDDTWSVCAMTQNEANDFQAIIERSELGPLYDNSFSRYRSFKSFIYLYLKIGSKDFEEFLQYLRDCQQNEGDWKLLSDALYGAVEAQKMIITASKLDSALPFSLRFQLSGFDRSSHM